VQEAAREVMDTTAELPLPAAPCGVALDTPHAIAAKLFEEIGVGLRLHQHLSGNVRQAFACKPRNQ
jgi:hypothetical protein